MKKFLIILLLFFMIGCSKQEKIPLITESKYKVTESDSSFEPINTSITISAVGDCTIGSDDNFGYARSFHNRYDLESGNKEYFFDGVKSVLETDDLTIANLETTFTSATSRMVKKFNFKGPKEYAQILPAGSVEIVNIANNHIYDYKEVGYQDTISNLKEINMPYFGLDNYYIYEVKNIKIGLIGYYMCEGYDLDEVLKGINYLKEKNVDLIFVEYHWGIEGNYKQNKEQTNIAHFTIDNGADLVIGSHPHVIQGIEKYKDKYIIYSLGNFVYGGHKNPTDKDSFIYQQTFNYENKELTSTSINIVPVRFTGDGSWNLYQPKLITGDEYTRVYNKIMKYSVNIEK